MSAQELADQFLARHGIYSQQHTSKLAESIRIRRRDWNGDRLVLTTHSNVDEKLIPGLAAKYCEAIDLSGEMLDQCIEQLTEHAMLVRQAHRWRAVCKHRGLQHSFDPPFFDHFHDKALTSTSVIFSRYLLGEGGDASKPLLNIRNPLQLLEVGSFEGSSAAWLAQYLLTGHSDSVLLCVDNWSPQNYIHGNHSIEKIMTNSLENDVNGGIARFKDNLARTPGGNRVVAAKVPDSSIALARLVSSSNARESFDFIYGKGIQISIVYISMIILTYHAC